MPTTAMARALGEFAAARHGTFTSSQAADIGITRHDLARMARDGVVVRLRAGVWRFTSTPPTWQQATYAATLGRRAVAGRFSAAALHGLDGLAEPPASPEILWHHGAPVRARDAAVYRTTSLPRADVTWIDGIPCTTMARTICDIAALVPIERVVQAIDDIQRRGASMAWLMDRATRLHVPGRSGPPTVLDIVGRRLDGYRVPDSWFERLLERALQSPLLVGLERQHALRDAHGDHVATFDLAMPWVRLGIEGHSRSYHLGELVERYDEDRDMRTSKLGWETMYLGFAATRSPRNVCLDIEEVVRRRMHDLGLVHPSGALSEHFCREVR